MRFYTGAMFMLVAHASYKALMFLGAGSVMHGMHEETDLQRMGGLIRRMPVTGWTFVVGAFALAGVFPLAGFFAKDQILEFANRTGRTWVYVLGTLGALLSALYIGRLLFLAFFGRPRSEEAEHAHESPSVMTDPTGDPRGGRDRRRARAVDVGGGHALEGPGAGRRIAAGARGRAADTRPAGDRHRDRARRARGRLVGLRLRPRGVAHAPRAAPADPARREERLVRRPGVLDPVRRARASRRPDSRRTSSTRRSSTAS